MKQATIEQQLSRLQERVREIEVEARGRRYSWGEFEEARDCYSAIRRLRDQIGREPVEELLPATRINLDDYDWAPIDEDVADTYLTAR